MSSRTRDTTQPQHSTAFQNDQEQKQSHEEQKLFNWNKNLMGTEVSLISELLYKLSNVFILFVSILCKLIFMFIMYNVNRVVTRLD